MYIGIISDTHCWFDDPLKKFLDPVDEIWHAGDFGNEETLLQIADFKPLKGVYGNCDGTQVRGRVPYTQFFECGGKRVLMMHIGGYPGRYDYKAFRLPAHQRPSARHLRLRPLPHPQSHLRQKIQHAHRQPRCRRHPGLPPGTHRHPRPHRRRKYSRHGNRRMATIYQIIFIFTSAF